VSQELGPGHPISCKARKDCFTDVTFTFVCMCIVGSILLYFVFFCVGLIDFAVSFCCPYQCK